MSSGLLRRYAPRNDVASRRLAIGVCAASLRLAYRKLHPPRKAARKDDGSTLRVELRSLRRRKAAYRKLHPACKAARKDDS